MTGTPDKDSQTEDATEKRIQDAMERGQIPFSREVVTAAGLFAIAATFAITIPALSERLFQSLGRLLETSADTPLENSGDALQIVWNAFESAARMVAASVAILAGASLVSSFAQNAPRVALDRIALDTSRISIAKGLGRILSLQGLFEVLKGLVKIFGVTLAGYLAVAGAAMPPVANALYLNPEAIPQAMLDLVERATLFAAAIMAVVAAADFISTRRMWARDLRMSKQEVKDEIKQNEGDIAQKRRFRGIGRARLKRRMMANVPHATLVIANPTHYAIALRYVRDEGGSPKVVAKGKNLIAIKIREIAEQNGIPIYEDKRLARSLFDNVEPGRLLPSEFYKAVAEIIIFLGSRSKPLPMAR